MQGRRARPAVATEVLVQFHCRQPDQSSLLSSLKKPGRRWGQHRYEWSRSDQSSLLSSLRKTGRRRGQHMCLFVVAEVFAQCAWSQSDQNSMLPFLRMAGRWGRHVCPTVVG